MATRIPLFNKVKPPKDAKEWLKEYEELLKRNKGGGTLVGYDTSSYRPIYVPGQVSDPTGIGDYAGQTLDYNMRPMPKSGLIATPEEEQGLLDALVGMRDNPDITDKELQDLEMVLDAFAGSDYQPSQPQTPSAPPQPPQVEPQETSTSFPQPSATPLKPPTSTATTALPQYEEGTIGSSLLRYAQVPLSEIMAIDDPQVRQFALTQRQQGLDLMASLQNKEITPTPTPDNSEAKLAAMNRIENVAKDAGADNLKGFELPDYKAPEPPKTNPIRQLLGDTADFVGGVLGIPETNWSERIAGGPTRNTGRVYAADDTDYSISETDPNQSYQPGEGVSRLKELFRGPNSQSSNTFKRPEVNKVAGTSRLVGDIGGIGETAKMAAMKGQSDVSDPFFKSGAVELYKDQLTSGDPQRAKEQYGGALNLGLFKDSFYTDPNDVASVFGNTYMGKEATDKFRQSEAAKYPLMDYGGIDDAGYRSQVDTYNQAIRDYLGSIPSVLRSDVSYGFSPPSSARPFYDKTNSTSQTPSASPYIKGKTDFQPGFSMAKPVYTPPQPSSSSGGSSQGGNNSYTPPNQPVNIPLSNVGVGSNIPSSSSGSRPAPTPVPTPTRYIPPNQPVQVPLATYGVGSVSPAPAPQPAQPSVFSWIRNLFRRR